MFEGFRYGFLCFRFVGLLLSSATLKDCSDAEELLDIDSFSSMHSLRSESSEFTD